MARAVTCVALALAAGATSALLAGCTASRPSGPADVRGVITSVEETSAGDGVGSILVVWTANPAVGARTTYDAAQLSITEETKIERGAALDETSESLTLEQLRIGDIVEVWLTDGPVAESYPVQASAAFVLVKGAFEGELPVPPGLEPSN